MTQEEARIEFVEACRAVVSLQDSPNHDHVRALWKDDFARAVRRVREAIALLDVGAVYGMVGKVPAGDRQTEVDVPALYKERDKLLAFKTYVHSRLDKMGVPKDPPSPHQAEGCRVGGRLDWVQAELEMYWRLKQPKVERLPDREEYLAVMKGLFEWCGALREVAKDDTNAKALVDRYERLCDSASVRVVENVTTIGSKVYESNGEPLTPHERIIAAESKIGDALRLSKPAERDPDVSALASRLDVRTYIDLPPRWRGKTKEWVSVCSQHQTPDPTCTACRTGSYVDIAPIEDMPSSARATYVPEPRLGPGKETEKVLAELAIEDGKRLAGHIKESRDKVSLSDLAMPGSSRTPINSTTVSLPGPHESYLESLRKMTPHALADMLEDGTANAHVIGEVARRLRALD